MISFAAGGWVILLAVALVLAVLAWTLSAILRTGGLAAVGDGRNVATYGFDLSTCLIPRDEIVAGGLPKDGLAALVDPPVMPGREVKDLNRRMHGKYLVSNDRVIGVVINERSRAYPLRVLNWHEVVNDVVGGVPIAVTYNPLCDSVVVFDRRVGDETREFGVSGLLYNSNLLMYDRRAQRSDESLWSQLQCRAVAGPAAAAGLRLRVRHSSVVCWADWLVRHPETEVLVPDAAMMDQYKRDPYASYYGSDRLRFPVRPLPSDDGRPMKTPVVVVRVDDREGVFSIPAVASLASASGRWRADVGGRAVYLTCRANPPTAWVEAVDPATRVETIYAFWFAWYAMHPDAVLMPRPAGGRAAAQL